MRGRKVSGSGLRASGRRNVKRFRGGLVFKAHRLVYHSTLGLRVIKKRKKIKVTRVWGVGFREQQRRVFGVSGFRDQNVKCSGVEGSGMKTGFGFRAIKTFWVPDFG